MIMSKDTMWTAGKIIHGGCDGQTVAYNGTVMKWYYRPPERWRNLLYLAENESQTGRVFYRIHYGITRIDTYTYDWTGIGNIFSRTELGLWGSDWNLPAVSLLDSLDNDYDWEDSVVEYVDVIVPDVVSISYMTGGDGGEYKNGFRYIRLRETGKLYSMQKAFINCPNLTAVTIDTLSACTYVGEQKEFSGCTALTDVRIGELPPRDMSLIGLNESPLTHESLLGLLNALPVIKNKYGFQLGETNIAKLSEDEIAIATNKGWTLV